MYGKEDTEKGRSKMTEIRRYGTEDRRQIWREDRTSRTKNVYKEEEILDIG